MRSSKFSLPSGLRPSLGRVTSIFQSCDLKSLRVALTSAPYDKFGHFGAVGSQTSQILKDTSMRAALSSMASHRGLSSTRRGRGSFRPIDLSDHWSPRSCTWNQAFLQRLSWTSAQVWPSFQPSRGLKFVTVPVRHRPFPFLSGNGNTHFLQEKQEVNLCPAPKEGAAPAVLLLRMSIVEVATLLQHIQAWIDMGAFRWATKVIRTGFRFVWSSQKPLVNNLVLFPLPVQTFAVQVLVQEVSCTDPPDKKKKKKK